MRRAVFEDFEAMGIPVLRGRAFTREDTLNAPVAAVVNAALAARVFPGEDAVGKRVRFASGSPDQPWMTIVGVVGNIRHASLEEVPKPELYITYRQGPPVVPFLVIRTTGDAADLAAPVRQAMRELGANPPTDIRTMAALRSGSVASRRFVLMLVALFGVLALGLAALGVFGVITLIAAERTTEVGIRLALGATPSRVLGLVVGHALKLGACRDRDWCCCCTAAATGAEGTAVRCWRGRSTDLRRRRAGVDDHRTRRRPDPGAARDEGRPGARTEK